MSAHGKELLLEHVPLPLPGKARRPAVPGLRPPPGLLTDGSSLDLALPPDVFLDTSSRTDADSPCLQVDQVSAGLSWRPPEPSRNWDTQTGVPFPPRPAAGRWKDRAALEKPFRPTAEERPGTHGGSRTPSGPCVRGGRGRSSAVGSLEVARGLPRNVPPSALCPTEHLGSCAVSFHRVPPPCAERTSHSSLITSLL